MEESVGQRLKNHRIQVLHLATKHGAKNVRVFGSVARGESRPDSDLDLLVEVDHDHSPFFPGGLLMDLEELLGCRVDIVTENGLHRLIHDHIVGEAKPL